MRNGIIACAFLALFTFSSFTSEEEKFVWQNWNDGFSRASKENKIALIDTYTEWCGWCKKMDKDTYANPTIAKKINENFIPIKFNPELEGLYNVGDTTIDGRTLLAALSQGERNSYPTTFFFLPKQNRMVKYAGYMDALQFGELLDKLVLVHSGQAQESAN